MLDTVILQIPINKSAIIDHSQFTPSTKGILDNPANFYKYTNNPKKADRESGVYKPRLTIIKRGKEIYLKAEFSVPKLLFSNNLNEIEESNFDEAVSKLRKIIEQMGVRLWTHEIEKAEVLGFHLSKNIPLTNGYTSLFVIRELSKINLSQKFDLTKIVYRNNGEELQFYSNRHSLVFYDKINDLNKPAKRAVDKDQIKQQTDLFEYIKREKRNIEVLKMEVRLSEKRKMNDVLEKLGYLQNPTFKDIFKKELCQKILKHYWNYFFNDNLFLFDVRNNPQTILNLILKRNPKIGIKKAIYQTGFLGLCKDDEGMRGFRSIAELYKPKTNWANLKRWLTNYQTELNVIPFHGFIKDIEESLDNFEAFRLNRK